MKDFETFKESRFKVDPSARNLSEQQWQQAYVAYRKSRKRVGRSQETLSDDSVSGVDSKRSRNGQRSRRKGEAADRSFLNTRHLLIEQIRANSAYAELRMLVDTLAWVATGLVLLGLVIKFYFFSAVLGLLTALFAGILQLIAVFAVRKLFQVLLDIGDLAIERKQREIGGISQTDKASKTDEFDA